VQGKREMTRVVRTPQGQVEIDPTGKRNGRGAYVHQARSCWEAALSGDRLAHALKATLSDPDRQALETFAVSLPIEEITNGLRPSQEARPETGGSPRRVIDREEEVGQ
jgi:predicted RNA-binding protein YlxR (DUF448 family)